MGGRIRQKREKKYGKIKGAPSRECYVDDRALDVVTAARGT